MPGEVIRPLWSRVTCCGTCWFWSSDDDLCYEAHNAPGDPTHTAGEPGQDPPDLTPGWKIPPVPQKFDEVCDFHVNVWVMTHKQQPLQ